MHVGAMCCVGWFASVCVCAVRTYSHEKGPEHMVPHGGECWVSRERACGDGGAGCDGFVPPGLGALCSEELGFAM